jgi:hypothetical protein
MATQVFVMDSLYTDTTLNCHRTRIFTDYKKIRNNPRWNIRIIRVPFFNYLIINM